MLMLYRGSTSDRVRGASTLAAYSPFSFTFAEGPKLATNAGSEADWLSYLYDHPATTPHWSNYVKGPVFFARISCGEAVLRGFDFVVDSSIPAGGGASSSSALVVLASAAVRDVNEISYEPGELARGAAKAEWYVGTRGGEMDHITMCLARRDHAVLISFLDQQTRYVSLPGQSARWITFFTQPADKGRDVMIEYNERAALSRIVLPALIDGWQTKRPELHARWISALQSLKSGAAGALDEIETLLRELPGLLTLNELGRDYPEAFAACARSFPILVAERAERSLPLRSRALHHIGEVRRVKTAIEMLDNLSQPKSSSDAAQDPASLLRQLGLLLDQSHASLRDLYEVSTPEVERVIELIRACPGVYGAHLMGGGFGGNVLALIASQNVETVIDRVQTEYYEPQARQGVNEGSVMVSTPGDGLTSVTVEALWRQMIEVFNTSGKEDSEYRAAVNAMLDSISPAELPRELWPVVVAAGKGTRAHASGMSLPKPLAPILGVPAILHVLRNIRTAFGQTRPPTIIVSPETELQIRSAIALDKTFGDVTFVVQPEALGTGDAVLCAREQLKNFSGLAMVVWGTQPAIQPETMRRALKLANLFSSFQMIIPTAYLQRPYAPLLRDNEGRVRTARETHLEKADQPLFGESNIGMFILKSGAMFAALVDLNQRYFNEAERRYERPGGELGFPNELVNYFSAQANGVFAASIADSDEEQGIKKLADIEACERIIAGFTKR
jgi:galactokinase/CTP:molybdopterin cytidylyltransferase MocA